MFFFFQHFRREEGERKRDPTNTYIYIYIYIHFLVVYIECLGTRVCDIDAGQV